MIEEAVEALHEGAFPHVPRAGWPATGSMLSALTAAGAMSVYIAVHGVRPRLILLGGGHVNRAIAQLAAFLNIDIHVGGCVCRQP
ncbi:Uncharacterised protein [Morganella morganii]|nr:Uncharacterised protein [Morganella morganii]